MAVAKPDFDAFDSSARLLDRRRRLLLSASVACLPLVWHPRVGASLPREMRIIVPFAPGAGTDAMARMVAEKLSPLLGLPVVVENKTGASGAIGARAVAAAPADGSVLLLAASPFTTVAATMPSAGYDPVGDFVPVSMLASGPLLWVTQAAFPARDLGEWVRVAKRHPGRYNYGSAGVGGINHLALELLKAETGIFVVHIPYRGIAPATADLLGGQLHLMTGTIPALAGHVREGRLRALAVSTRDRTPALPDVPSLTDCGLAQIEVQNYFGLMAPKGTPDATVQRLHAAIAQIMAMPDVRERLARDALEPRPLEPQAWGRFIQQDVQAWRDLARRRNIQVEG
jgi:tripartite-type tricarboxylate transporter receptor subunit TctC